MGRLDPCWTIPTLQPGVGLGMDGFNGCTLLLVTWLQALCWAIMLHRGSTEVLQQGAASPQLLDKQSQQRGSIPNLKFSPLKSTISSQRQIALFGFVF